MLKKQYYVLLIPNQQQDVVDSEIVLVKASTEVSAKETALNHRKDCTAKVYTQPQLVGLGERWVLQELLKEMPVDYHEILALKNHSFDLADLEANLYQMDSKMLVSFIIFLSLHNIKLQREIGFNADGESYEYQQAVLLLFTKLADCLDMLDEILEENLDCSHHIDSILDYIKFIVVASKIPVFKSIRYLLNPHLRVLLKRAKGQTTEYLTEK